MTTPFRRLLGDCVVEVSDGHGDVVDAFALFSEEARVHAPVVERLDQLPHDTAHRPSAFVELAQLNCAKSEAMSEQTHSSATIPSATR